jgi:predicted permease
VLTGGETPREVQAAGITQELLPLLGISPALGRAFTADEVAREDRVALIADEFWSTELASDPKVIGRTVMLDAEPYTVVGVMPPGFTVPMSPSRVWTPLVVRGGTDRGRRFLRVIGRLRDGVTLDAAAASMTIVTGDLARDYPATNDGWTITLVSLEEAIVGASFRRAAFVLLAVVGLVLLIACANVSNLMLSRVVARRRESAVQTALGATRHRIVKQWLLESAWLGVVAAPIGLLLGMWAIALLRALGPASVPRFEDIRIDATTALFTFGLSLGAAVAFGLAPALVAARHADARTLAGRPRGSVGQRDGERLRGAVLIAQMTLAVLLLVGAALLVQSFRRIQRIDLGFQPAGLAFMQLSLPEARYGEGARPRFFTTLLERVAALPGVDALGAVSSAPFGGGNSGLLFLPEHMTPPAGDQPPDADYRIVTPGYFGTIGIPIVSGRTFRPGEGEADRVAIISRATAERYWPGTNPLGRRFRARDTGDGPLVTVVGVAGNARYYDMVRAARPMIYFPHDIHEPAATMTVLLRTSGDATALIDVLRREVAAQDPQLALSAAGAYEDVVDVAFAEPRFHASLFGAFALVALVLASVGLYAVVAHSVAERTRELGVRIALGARTVDVLRMVVGRGVRLAAAGILCGLAGALALSRLLDTLLFETSPLEPAAYVAVAALLLSVAAAASYVPARKAARLDPSDALRR